MAEKKSRDWSEWKNHLEGKDRLGEDWKKNRKTPAPKLHERQTTTAFTLPHDFIEDQDEPLWKRKWVWIIALLSFLIIKKAFVDHSNHKRSHQSSHQSRISR